MMGESNAKEMSTQKYEIYTRKIEKREGSYAEYPDSLNPDLKAYLMSKNIKQLYTHQAEMFEQAKLGKNVVITTSTASGKTLSFLLPVIDKILAEPSTRAIFIYPTKALASDQLRAMRPILDYFGENRISAGVYDGDTPVNERARIKETANIILTNPEMLNASFLPHHSKKSNSFIFSNLRFVVVDELHYYRGAFGSHLANVFKRLQRICMYYNSEPKYLCSSATIANPLELAQNMFGKEFVLVDKDGSPAPQKNYHFIEPPYIKDTDFKMSVGTIAAELIPELVVRKKHFIAFCKSRNGVEVVLKEAKNKLASDYALGVSLSHLIEGYRGGYKPHERKAIDKRIKQILNKAIEEKMVNGEIFGLVSTNALELGIDIGKVDTTVIVGYPDTKASFWQQTGRAGRNKEECDNYLILDARPFDQFISVKPEWLFDTGSENAVIDPNNLFIQLAHVRAAAAELPLTLDDTFYFSNLAEIIPILIKAGELRTTDGRKFSWCGKDFPAGDYSLRNMDNDRYEMINQVDGNTITELDELQAYREAHEKSIYIHNGQIYKVTELNTETKRIIAVPVNDEYYTVPMDNENICVIRAHKDKQLGRTNCFFGDITVHTSVCGHKKVQFHNHDNLGFEDLPSPLTKSYDTEGTWIPLPENVKNRFRTLPENMKSSIVRSQKSYSNRFYDYLGGLSFTILNSALMLTMTTKSELGACTIETGQDMNIYIYDLFVGGLGYSEKVYDKVDEVIKNAISSVSGCNCKNGCASCVGDYHLDKKLVLWGLQCIYEELTAPEEEKTIEPEKIIIEKPFKYENIETTDWKAFVDLYSQTNETLAKFVTQIINVRDEEGTLYLYLQNQFYCDWLMSEENKMILTNVIKHYFDVPACFEIKAEALNEENTFEIEEKLRKRYGDLVD